MWGAGQGPEGSRTAAVSVIHGVTGVPPRYPCRRQVTGASDQEGGVTAEVKAGTRGLRA